LTSRSRGELLGPDGRLASEKTFTRGDVIIAAAPHLHGLPVSVLDQAVENVLAHGDAVALPVVTGSREQVWTARCVLADEERIATLAESLTGEEGPKIESSRLDAVARLEERLGASLSATSTRWQSALVSGHRLDLVMVWPGPGKRRRAASATASKALANRARTATRTSGQEPRRGRGMDSRTVASLSCDWSTTHSSSPTGTC